LETLKKVKKWSLDKCNDRLDCYQKERRQVKIEPKTIHTADQTWTHSLHCHNGAVRVKVTKSAFYSNHITLSLSGPIATSFLKGKSFTKHAQTRKNKTTQPKMALKSQIQKMHSTKLMQWNMTLKKQLSFRSQNNWT